MSIARKNIDKSKADSKLYLPNSSTETASLPNNFHFFNGDEYTGEFTIIRDKQIFAMQGRGVYNTFDGQIYEGIWENDLLKEECKITFPDKSIFSGDLNEMMITGPGKYLYKENVQIEGNFTDNNISGNIYLKDPNQNYWKGKIGENEEFVDLYPLHPFWQSVLNSPSQVYPLFYGEAEGESLWEDNE